MTHILQESNIFVTGGAGTLGRALARRRKEEGWTGKYTVYSTDDHKHDVMRKIHSDINFVQGDIRNPETLYNAMVGHDIVIHAAAVKVIPVSEYWSIDTYDVNVNGSLNVAIQAIRANIKHVLGISTDKACHPANAYGATKMLMEKCFQEYSRIQGLDTQFHLVRYGNVLESTGSVIEAWNRAVEAGETVKITDPEMTRFWLSPRQAVKYVIQSLELTKSGLVFIPKMQALSLGKMAEYVLGKDYKFERIPLRPGEKIHETLLTNEESHYVENLIGNDYYILNPTTSARKLSSSPSYSSDKARQLSKDELMDLLND